MPSKRKPVPEFLRKFRDQLKIHTRERKRAIEASRMLRDLGPIEGIGDYTAWPPLNEITLALDRAVSRPLPVVRAITARVRSLTGERVKVRKSFSEHSGRVQFEFRVKSSALRVELNGADPKCELRKVKVPVHQPATNYNEDRYVLVNPVECLGKQGAEDYYCRHPEARPQAAAEEGA